MHAKHKAPIWFLIVTVLLICWNLIGVLSFYTHIMMINDPSILNDPALEILYTQYPTWTTIIFALASISGIAAAILMAMKRRIAKFIFVISLIAVIMQMTHNLFMTDSIEYLGAQAAILPTLVVIVGIFSVWLSSFADRKKWLR
ncbi:MAG: hypothetical protein ACPG21_00295 [Crocinitomicaceae bacterium]